MSKRLPPLMIQGFSVRDYANGWIVGACPLHQWSSGARGIDQKLIRYVEGIIVYIAWQPITHRSIVKGCPENEGLIELLRYLIFNEGHPAEKYIPDEHSAN